MHYSRTTHLALIRVRFKIRPCSEKCWVYRYSKRRPIFLSPDIKVNHLSHFTNDTIMLSNILLNDMLWQVLMFYFLTKFCFYFKSMFILIMQLLLWIFPQYLQGSLSYEIQVGYLTCNGKLNRNWNIQLFTEYKLPLLWCVCCCL